MVKGARSVVWVTLIGAALLVICAYAGLVPYGHWQPDEFQTVVSYRTDPINFFWHRLSTWSPRPLSEALIYLYVQAIEAAREPLITEALVLSWSLLFCAALFPLWTSGRREPAEWFALLGQRLSLLCLFLLAHGVAEVFYWPMAALAYLPTLGAIVFLYALAEEGCDASGTRVGIALTVAAASTEVGAMYVVCHTLVALACMAWFRIVPRRGTGIIAFLLPLLIALAVLYRLSEGRVAANGETFGDPRYIHHLLPSILAALPHALWEAVAADSLPISPLLLVVGAGIKIAFFTGACIVAATRPLVAKSWRARVPLAIACFAMIPATLAAAYYQFGTMACCERHATFRQCLALIGLASSAALVGMLPFVRTRILRLGSPSLLAAAWFGIAIAIGFTASYPSLRADYASRDLLQNARSATWSSAVTETDRMEVIQTQPGRIVGGYPLFPAGTYVMEDHSEPEVSAMLLFFGKAYGSLVDPDSSISD